MSETNHYNSSATFPLRDRTQAWHDLPHHGPRHLQGEAGQGRIRPWGGDQHLGHYRQPEQSHHQGNQRLPHWGRLWGGLEGVVITMRYCRPYSTSPRTRWWRRRAGSSPPSAAARSRQAPLTTGSLSNCSCLHYHRPTFEAAISSGYNTMSS